MEDENTEELEGMIKTNKSLWGLSCKELPNYGASEDYRANLTSARIFVEAST